MANWTERRKPVCAWGNAVVCSDGSVWQLNHTIVGKAEGESPFSWEQLPPIPGSAADCYTPSVREMSESAEGRAARLAAGDAVDMIPWAAIRG